ncbi:glycosyl hydrolase [Actinomadura sp. NPDC047616]|uniref:glycosyl hydrolase n=1 Tax=Actinomadura sp. NPDC047616 TaxID=3155914 RepID=UPI0033CE2993
MLPARLRTVLETPPRAFSPAPFWWWSGDRLDRRRLRDQLERFAAGGVHNLVIINLAPSGPMFGADADDPAFFGEAWWELLDGVCDDAAALGTSLWFYDQLGFSGAGLQARLVQERPEYAGLWLDRDGGPPAPRGFDYLSAEACATLLDRVHGEFERRLGHRLGTVIVGSFQDELPSLPTWSAPFAEEFERRRGYDPTPRLHRLWSGDDGDPGGREFRRDYHFTRAEMAEEAFFRPLAEWHGKHGLLHGCDQQDPARAGFPVDGVRLYADYARTHRWFGAPGSDHHGDARVHSSLAHLYGRDRTWIESFHSSGWGGTLEETLDWLLPWLRTGATLYNPHASYYSTRAGWWEWAPPSTDWRQPYWKHYRVFADAITRLCAALSLGRHVCDVAVLYPTATAQAGTRLDGVDAEAARAQDVYRSLVGDMAWFKMEPGVLDRLRVDADVIDDDSVRRARVADGRLTVADESYRTVLLPACTVLEGATARRLAEFAENGGRVVAVGPPPHAGVGDPDADAAVARLAGLLETVPDASGLAEVLDGDRRVEAPVPALVREVDGATLVFLTASPSMASRVSVERPDERGADLGWIDVTYDFDPDRYLRDMPVRVRGVTGPAYAIGLFDGTPRRLPTTAVDDHVELVVPFDDGPAALLVFPGTGQEGDEPARPVPYREIDLGSTWEMELVPTLDNTWGDFARPPGEPVALERWELHHRVEDDAGWTTVHATFGPHGVWSCDGTNWREAVYSDSRGIRKDTVHREFLGPKGHVPEEFLDFGPITAGQRVVFRTRVTVPAPGGFPAVGAAAVKTLLVDGAPTPLEDHGYLAVAKTPLAPGAYDLELRLVPDTDRHEDERLRAHVAVVTDPERYRRPEWITVEGPSRTGAQVALSTALPADAHGILQVASSAPCRIVVDDVEIGRQGGFDPYAEQQTPRVGRYDVTGQAGRELTLILTESDTPPAVLVDGPVTGWRATRDGEPAAVVPKRTQYGDPAALHLRRRPHPLPGAAWIEDAADDDGVVLPALYAVPGRGETLERFRFTVPPGATSMSFDVHGEVTGVFLDGRRLEGGPEFALPGGGKRAAELHVRTWPGHSGGAALAGPVRFTPGPGTIALGDWEDEGLAGYSGGVRYRRVVVIPADARGVVLDLGRVRGTAEVTVNATPCGVRVCAPYRFTLDDAALRLGEPNEIEVVVYGTLAPHLDETSPTHFVFEGQRVTGLFGPVLLRVPAKP